MSDSGLSYRNREEIQAMKDKIDPINYMKELLLKEQFATAEEIKV